MSAEVVNRLTGEARLTDDETGRAYGVVFDLSAVAQLEQSAGGRSIMELVASPPGATLASQMLAVGAAGYTRRNPGQQPPVNSGKLALKIISGCGGLVKVGAVLRESVARAQGLGLIEDDDTDDEEAEGVDDADPPPGPGPTP